ncbi:DUF4173 domain-containing protein [Streptomyces sp. NPDC001523]|uniref:DUF4153 domain-containing protein n=1 Tax=Streptomyces sp. NPDC001523 TaxID=3154383 RepID=UPI00332BB015
MSENADKAKRDATGGEAAAERPAESGTGMPGAGAPGAGASEAAARGTAAVQGAAPVEGTAAVQGAAPVDATSPGPAAAPPPAPPGSPGFDSVAWHIWVAQRKGPQWQQAQAEAVARAQASMARRVRSAQPAPIRTATLVAVLVAGLATAVLLGDGIGPGLLLAAVPAMVAAYVSARAAGRTIRPWTVVWSLGCVALLAVPALRDSAWPSTLAVLAAVLLAALALHGTRRWPGVLLSPLGFVDTAVTGVGWAWEGVRSRGGDVARTRWLPIAKATVVAVVLLLVFGALFASADAAFADLLGGLTPDISVGESPFRVALFLVGALCALSVARTAAAPLRWDRVSTTPGKPRSRVEWALPLIVLNLLFAGFIAVQLVVLLGGYDKVLERTDLTYAEYARQGFWQLLWATVFVLAVIALALRWAPRGGPGDRRFVRVVLGTLCLLTLVVVASAVRRMDLYVDAYGLTRLRLSVVTMELWLGLVIVLLMAAGAFGGRWLARAVAGSAAATVLAFGLMSPDGIIAETNVARYTSDKKIDVEYFRHLSADAAPALDRLPEPQRSCALIGVRDDLAESEGAPWFATSLAQSRARRILDARPVTATTRDCVRLGLYGGRSEY